MDFRQSSSLLPDGRPKYLQTRAYNFGLTMIVMGVSFALYYLGLFGGVEGPLNPVRMGERLASAGVSKVHLQVFLLACLALALAWNWIYNAACRMLGRRMICDCPVGKNTSCGKPVDRDGQGAFVCGAGHVGAPVRFEPLKKGTVAHFVWMMFLIFNGIVLYFQMI